MITFSDPNDLSMFVLFAPADTRSVAMAMAVGWSNRRDQSRESAFGTCDVWALLLPSYHSEQGNWIPAVHSSSHDI